MCRSPQPSSSSNRSRPGGEPRPSPPASVTESAVRQQQCAAPSTLTAASSSRRASIPLTFQDQEMSSWMDHIHSVPERSSDIANFEEEI